MKYLDYPALNDLSAELSSSPAPETKINVRLEAYSVKPVRVERKMFKEMEEAYMSGQDEMEEMSFSPEMKEAGLSSCFGRLDEKESRKVHFMLVSTLNAAFPDHDFSSLRPDHFTREPNAAVVFGHLSGTLSGQGPMGPPTSSPLLHPLSISSSPSGLQNIPMKPEHQRTLSEVIDLDNCEVYSWFPSPEYDPHAEAEEGELSEDEYEEELMDESLEVDMDIDENETEASWGQAGMELDMDVQPLQGGGVMESTSRRRGSKKGVRKMSGVEGAMLPPLPPMRGSDDESSGRRVGGLLWSTNYFFYSRRQKRILFLTCWSRKRTPFLLSPAPTESVFPAPISASYTPPSHLSTLAHRTRIRSRPNPLGRPVKKHQSKATGPGSGKNDAIEVDMTSMIPIRGYERSTPAPSARLASSAPAHTGSTFLSSPSGQGAFARMSAGGFKPTRTPARVLINAAKMSEVSPNLPHDPRGSVGSISGLDGPGGNKGTSNTLDMLLQGDRTRKQRSESTASPGPSLLRAGIEAHQAGQAGTGSVAGDSKGKRVKVSGSGI